MSNRQISVLYVTETQLDRNTPGRTGASVNEGEFIRGLLQCSQARTQVIALYRDNAKALADLPEAQVNLIRSHQGKFIGVPFYWIRLFFAIRKAIHQQQPDIIMYRLGPLPLVQVLIYLLYHHHFALKTFVNSSRLIRSQWGIMGALLAKIAEPLRRFLVLRAIAVDTVSEEFAKWIQRNYGVSPDILHVIPNGANVDKFIPASARRNMPGKSCGLLPRFLYAGALREYRGLDALVEAVASLQENERNFEIIIAGAGEFEKALREHIAKHDVAKAFNFVGWIAYEKLPELMWECHWGIDLNEAVLAQDDLEIRGSYSQKLAQYLAAGLPVIAWDIDGVEFLRDKGLGKLVHYRSIEHLAQTLQEAAQFSQQDDFLGQKEYASQFAIMHRSQAAVAAKRCTLYADLLWNK